jgi:hypothetical protein
MSAYATQCPRFRKINLALVPKCAAKELRRMRSHNLPCGLLSKERFSNLSDGNV